MVWFGFLFWLLGCLTLIVSGAFGYEWNDKGEYSFPMKVGVGLMALAVVLVLIDLTNG